MVSADPTRPVIHPTDPSDPHAELSDQDIRAIVRTLGKAAILPGDLPTKRRYLTAQIAKLVDADV